MRFWLSCSIRLHRRSIKHSTERKEQVDTEFAVRMVDITKHFGTITANKNVSLDIRKGEILSLLGENGSGKTTLMNMLSGIYYPDGGSIYVNGTRVDIRSPKDAFKLHIGMIHQHFKLVDVFTATENFTKKLRPQTASKTQTYWPSGRCCDYPRIKACWYFMIIKIFQNLCKRPLRPAANRHAPAR